VGPIRAISGRGGGEYSTRVVASFDRRSAARGFGASTPHLEDRRHQPRPTSIERGSREVVVLTGPRGQSPAG